MRQISLASGVLPEHGYETLIRAAGESGYPAVGLMVPDDWGEADTRRAGALIDRYALEVLDVEVAWINPGTAADPHHHRMIDVAAELGAANLLVVSSDPDGAATARVLADLCERAHPHGIRVALEFLMITEVRTLEHALAIVRAVDHPAAAVLVDTLHLRRGGADPDDLAALDPHLLPYVQLCDGPLDCAGDRASLLEDALDARLAPGEGELPLERTLAVLAPDLPLSLEVRSAHYRNAYPDPVRRAHAILTRTRAFLARCAP